MKSGFIIIVPLDLWEKWIEQNIADNIWITLMFLQPFDIKFEYVRTWIEVFCKSVTLNGYVWF